MGSYVTATARQKYFCSCKCVKCKAVMVTQGEMKVTYQSRYGLIGNTYSKASASVRDAAHSGICTEVHDMMNSVNQRSSFKKLNADNLCPECATSQPWGHKTVIKVMCCIAVAICMLFAVETLGMSLLTLVLSVGAVVGTWYGLTEIIDVCSLRKMKRINDPLCYPLVIVDSIPSGIGVDDPRLLAVLKEVLPRKPVAKSVPTTSSPSESVWKCAKCLGYNNHTTSKCQYCGAMRSEKHIASR